MCRNTYQSYKTTYTLLYNEPWLTFLLFPKYIGWLISMLVYGPLVQSEFIRQSLELGERSKTDRLI